MIIREPAVAGTFYPANPDMLGEMIEKYLDQAKDKVVENAPKAIIAPHAGFIYSGPIAASAYINLRKWASQYKRVVLLGPSHRIGFNGIASCHATHYKTPLGNLHIDYATIQSLEQEGLIICNDAAHLHEHSLEVQLPFLQKTLNQFNLIPLVVGDCNESMVSRVIERLWGGDETLFVISSDLSHYLKYEMANAKDRTTSDAIIHFEYDKLDYGDACGRNPIKGLLLSARLHHLHSSCIDLRNSGDTAGDKVRVVGYGAYLFH
jgi:hypothetical protein